MRILILLVPLLLLALPVSGQQKAKVPYRIEFDPKNDVSMLDKDEKTGKEGLFIRVRFTIAMEGNNEEIPAGEYKILIEEDGRKVREEDVPKPTPREDLSVVLAIDTSGSMREHGRMAQAKAAANLFLEKLPAKSDCGLILFDHEMRPPVLAPTPQRDLLRDEIRKVEPRGGTAYLDAAARGITLLSNRPKNQERALVILTDGIDLNSSTDLKTVIAQAKANKVHVYTIGIGEPGKLEQVSTALVLDHSGSMAPPADDNDTTPKIKALHAAAARFVSIMPSTGRTTLIPFSTTVATPREFSNDKKALIDAIQKLKPEGETAIVDATYAGIATLEADGAKGKRAVIAMTDGIDNSSRRRMEEVIERAKEAKIALHMLGFGRPGELDAKIMQEMAGQTGGKYYHAKNEKALLEIFENLSIQLHDDGIDETTLTQLAQQTGGQYFPAKNVQDLKFILEKVTQTITKKEYTVTFLSLRQVQDGTARNVSLKLRHGQDIVQAQDVIYQTKGVVVAEMNHMVYLVMLAGIGLLITLPAVMRRSRAV